MKTTAFNRTGRKVNVYIPTKEEEQTFVKHFSNYDDAFDYQNRYNMKLKKQGIKAGWLNVVPGPDDNYSVVDDNTAAELGLGSVCSASSTAFVSNPFNK